MIAVYATAMYVLFIALVCACGERWAKVNRFPISPIARAGSDAKLDISAAIKRGTS